LLPEPVVIFGLSVSGRRFLPITLLSRKLFSGRSEAALGF
jgi:hypothetical protein